MLPRTVSRAFVPDRRHQGTMIGVDMGFGLHYPVGLSERQPPAIKDSGDVRMKGHSNDASKESGISPNGW